MSEITDLQLTDLRCFEGAQAARLSRITLLVGENSTGKSSFLGCYKAFAQLANFDVPEDENYFNQEPFLMGEFDTIARSGAKKFSVDGKFNNHLHTRIQVTYSRGSGGEIEEQQIRIEFDKPADVNDYLEIRRPMAGTDTWKFKGKSFNFELDGAQVSFVPISQWLSDNVRKGHLPYEGELANFRKREEEKASPKRQAEFGKLVTFLRTTLPMPAKPWVAVEALDPTPPLRQRTYESDPLGKDDEGLRHYLAEMGKQLGLFTGLETRKLPGDTFELLVEMPDGKHNIMDVGYGVHSILGLLKLMYEKPRGTVFLLQQPEVHLHPSAQAVLTQLMVDSNYRFIVETHSDHFIDRLRICAMQKKHRGPVELSMIYFEPNKNKTKSQMHNISIDDDGNLDGAPKGYRKFFFNEAKILLGF